MFSKLSEKTLRKTVSVRCFCVHDKPQLSIPRRSFRSVAPVRVSALLLLQKRYSTTGHYGPKADPSDSYPLSSRKVPPHFSLRKSDSYPPSERRSEGQEANGNKWKGPACGKEAVYAGLLLDRSGAFWSPNAVLPTSPIVVAASPRYAICGSPS